ncbi:hypothetical protein FI667_g5116, partial [Globisporangium splendens]
MEPPSLERPLEMDTAPPTPTDELESPPSTPIEPTVGDNAAAPLEICTLPVELLAEAPDPISMPPVRAFVELAVCRYTVPVVSVSDAPDTSLAFSPLRLSAAPPTIATVPPVPESDDPAVTVALPATLAESPDLISTTPLSPPFEKTAAEDIEIFPDTRYLLHLIRSSPGHLV